MPSRYHAATVAIWPTRRSWKSAWATLRPAAIINCAAHVGSVHYAMRNSADMMQDNVQIIMNLYRAVQRVCPTAKIIHPISNCSYPGEAVVQRESEWLDGPVHPSVRAFGSHRRLIYEVADCYRRQHGIRSINWLIPNAYGPGDRTDPDRVHALNGIIIRLIQAQCRVRKLRDLGNRQTDSRVGLHRGRRADSRAIGRLG